MEDKNSPAILLGDAFPEPSAIGEKVWQPSKPSDKDSVTVWLRALLADKNGLTAKMIAQTAIDGAIKGQIKLIEYVTDRTEGKIGAIGEKDLQEIGAGAIVKIYELMAKERDALKANSRPLSIESDTSVPVETVEGEVVNE